MDMSTILQVANSGLYRNKIVAILFVIDASDATLATSNLANTRTITPAGNRVIACEAADGYSLPKNLTTSSLENKIGFS